MGHLTPTGRVIARSKLGVMANSECHVALMPSAGMGHLTPFLRLASKLLSFGCRVTVITGKPIFTIAEDNHLSSFLSNHSEVEHLEFEVLAPENVPGVDSFFLQYDAIRRSAHLAFPLLQSSQKPFSAIICDLIIADSVPRFASEIGIPCFVFITTSARMLSFLAHIPQIASGTEKIDLTSSYLEVPGMEPFDMMSIPRLFVTPGHFMSKLVSKQVTGFRDATGLILNSFDWLEAETLQAFEKIRASIRFPPAIPLGPLEEYNQEITKTPYMAWLDEQPLQSVVYLNFGSRTAASRDQIRELGLGLEKSKFRFLWVVKTSKIDKEDKDELSSVLGVEFMERTKEQGLILKEWVNQWNILSHSSIGGFVSHCGWNSVMEAAQRGVPVLGWPQHGDQGLNAEVTKKAGLGMMEKTWGFGLEKLVTADEVAAKITELMTDYEIRSRATKVKEEAEEATAPGGTSYKTIVAHILTGT